MIKNHDFSFAIPPEEVGMQTGATIHTMNGLKMYVSTVDEEAPIPETENWWTKQHLKRGLSASGQPFVTEEEAALERKIESQKLNMELSLPNEN